MLFVASTLSISSFRLMVIVLFKRGGSRGAGEFGEAEDAGSRVEPSWFDPLEAAAGTGFSAPIAGGSDGSDGSSWTGRFTITVSPASLATPPASAQTSRNITSLSTWQTLARPTA